MYGSSISIQNPTRFVAFTHSFSYLKTESLHRWLNLSIPYFSTSCLLLRPSSFSTSISTGRPCVSQPAFRCTWKPRIVLYLSTRSFTTLVRMCPGCGSPFAVGGPSMKMNLSQPFRCSTLRSKVFSLSHNSNISSSSSAKSIFCVSFLKYCIFISSPTYTDQALERVSSLA